MSRREDATLNCTYRANFSRTFFYDGMNGKIIPLNTVASQCEVVSWIDALTEIRGIIVEDEVIIS